MLNINSTGNYPKINNVKATRDRKTAPKQLVSSLLCIKHILALGLCLLDEDGLVLGPLLNMKFPNVAFAELLVAKNFLLIHSGNSLCSTAIEIFNVCIPTEE